MKHLTLPALACAVIVLALSCGSVDPAKRYPNMVANLDPVSAGTIEAEFDRFFSSKLNKTDVEVIFYPRLNAVALKFRYESVTYRQFWDQTARKQFADALERYKIDYAERKLSTNYNRTRAVYGRVKGHIEWETFRITITHIAYPNIEMGYRFRENSPFFTTLMRPALDTNKYGEESRAESQRINMYFTRTQAEDLVKLFDQAYLLGLIGGRDAIKPMEPLILDEYLEFDN